MKEVSQLSFDEKQIAEYAPTDKVSIHLKFQPHFILMQCTGLRDKNGKLIQEGDIIEVPDNYNEFGQFAGEKYEVYFKSGGFRLKPKFDKKARGCWLEDDNTFKVIGNIYENPELLEDK